MASLPLEYERVEPPSGADPDHRPYEGQLTAACDGVELLGKVSNLHCGGQGPEACRLADPALRAEGAIRTLTGLAVTSFLGRVSALPPLPLVFGANYLIHPGYVRSTGYRGDELFGRITNAQPRGGPLEDRVNIVGSVAERISWIFVTLGPV